MMIPQPYKYKIITDTTNGSGTSQSTNLQMEDINSFKKTYPFESDVKASQKLYDILGKLKTENSAKYINLLYIFHRDDGRVDKLDRGKIIRFIFRYIEKYLNKQDTRNKDLYIPEYITPDLITGFLDEWFPDIFDGGNA